MRQLSFISDIPFKIGHLWRNLKPRGFAAGRKAPLAAMRARRDGAKPKSDQPRGLPTIKASRGALRAELQALLDAPHRRFVIFTHPETGRFVQFLGPSGEGEGLTLDLPLVALRDEEIGCARDCFRKLQLKGVPISRAGGALMAKLGADPPCASRVALAVFKRVYRLPPNDRLTVEFGTA
jgi:hypothetical protein